MAYFMRQTFLSAALLLAAASATAQPGTPNINRIQSEGRAPWRTEFISYDIRGESDAGKRDGSKYFRSLVFKPGTASGLFETVTEIPALWLDRDIYIRDEGRTGRYRLIVNGHEAGLNTDSYGTNDFHITRFLKEGTNRIALEFPGDLPGGEMEDFTPGEARRTIENLYIWSQPRIHIFDYTATGHHDEEVGDVILDLDIVVVNSYNTDEKISVGYDIYDPNNVLKDYTFVDAVIPARGCDTVRFRNKVFGTEKFRYSAEHPGLYGVTLQIRYEGRPIEYIPVKVGFGLTGFDGEHATRNGEAIHISAVEFDAPVRRNTLDRLKLLKRRGINTLYLTHPQQKWFYDMCASEGLYIIDRAAVECDPKGGDRSPGGTAANDPTHTARFIDRQQAMYYRNRNRPNVIGWAIGSDSGNGYNMYESYRWLNGADTTRMVVYPFVGGEWNSDVELPDPKPLNKILETSTAR